MACFEKGALNYSNDTFWNDLVFDQMHCMLAVVRSIYVLRTVKKTLLKLR